jgi:RimJ/RimL family protein N-acetyltransferase
MFAKVLEADYSRGKLRLVKPALEYAGLSLVWVSDEEVGRYMGADFSDVSTQTEEKRIRDILGGDDTYGWMIELDGRVIGAIEVNSIRERSEEYGLKAGNFAALIGEKDQWGKGIGSAAERAVMDWGFAEGGFGLFVGRALVINERSWRGLERLGFEFSGLKPDILDGKPVEWRVYTMKKGNWEKMK